MSGLSALSHNADRLSNNSHHLFELSKRNVPGRSVLETHIDANNHNDRRHPEDYTSDMTRTSNIRGLKAEFSLDSTTVKKIWRSFAEESTCHGLKRVVDRRRRMVVRIVWLILLAVMLAVLIGTMFLMLSHYMKHPTVTRTDVRIQTNADFPSVTICNNSPFKNLNGTTDNPLFRAMKRQSILQELYDTDDQPTDPDYVEFMTRPAQDVINAYAFTKEDLIHGAHYEGQPLDIDKDFESALSTPLHCFTFNGPEYIAKHGIRKAKWDGRGSGLRMLININHDLYVPFERLTVGIRLYVTHHPETPRFDKDGFDVGPGTSTSVALQPVKFEFLPHPYESFVSGSCVDTDDADLRDKMHNATFYSRHMCLFQCYVSLLTKKCGCNVDVSYVEGLPPCTFREYMDCYGIYLSEMKDQELNKSCDCPRPCKFTHYDSVLSSAQIPSKPFQLYSKIVNESSMDHIRRLRL